MLFWSYPPTTILSGWRLSCKAAPSLKNSGFMHNPKSSPSFFWDFSPRLGSIKESVVEGVIVLFATTTWYLSISFRANPISSDADFIWPKSIEPSGNEGVPTQMKVISLSFTQAVLSIDPWKSPASTTSFTSSSRPGS